MKRSDESISSSPSEPDNYFDISDELSEQIFEREIVPDIGVNGPPARQPMLVIVGGPNASGKTTAIRHAEAWLNGPTQKLIADDLVAYVPGYHELAKTDPGLAQEEAGDFIGDWYTGLRDRAIERRANIVLEYSSPVGMEHELQLARMAGHRTALYLVASPKEMSWTSTLDRTDRALKQGHIGTNAMVSKSGHDQRYADWPRAVFDAEQTMQFDSIFVARRDGTVMYENQAVMRGNGTKAWASPPLGFESVMLERNRALGPAEAQSLITAWNRITESPQLKADRFTSSMPLSEYRKEIVDFVGSEGSQFDPFTQKARDFGRAAAEWGDHLAKDLHLVRSSRNNLGPSPAFDQHTLMYAAAMKDLAYGTVTPGKTIRRLGNTSDSRDLPSEGKNAQSVRFAQGGGPIRAGTKVATETNPMDKNDIGNRGLHSDSGSTERAKRTFDQTEIADVAGSLSAGKPRESENLQAKRPQLGDRSRSGENSR